MRIVLATPLYPPDIADPAPYSAELARRLAPHHEVTVVTYGRYPEDIPGVQVVSVDKRLPSYTRALRFRAALQSALKGADLLYLQSGVSAEFPALLIQHKAKILWRQSKEPVRSSLFRKLIKLLTLRNATPVIPSSELDRPEIMPLEARPEKALRAWEDAWRAHVAHIETL